MLFFQIQKWMFVTWIMIGIVALFSKPSITFDTWLIGGGVGCFLLGTFLTLVCFGFEKSLEYTPKERPKPKYTYPSYDGDVLPDYPELPESACQSERQTDEQVDPRLKERARTAYYWGKRGAVKVVETWCPVCKQVTPHYVYNFSGKQCAWHV